MTKKYCDCCSGEIKGQCMPIDIPCHLWSMSGKVNGGYTDGDGNYFSGRYDKIDLCNRCANEVFSASVKKIKELGGSHE